MEAFRDAVETWGADMLELDVRATSDGEVVVIHDATVDRTTDATGPVCDMPFAAVRELDAGCRFVDPEGRATFSGRGVCIPRLDEVLEAFPRMRLNVEIKSADAARATVDLVRRHGAASRVLIAAAEEGDRREVRGYEGPWGASRRQLMPFWILHRVPLLSWTYTPAADALQVPPTWGGRTIVTPRFVREAHRRNIPVHVWTVDDPDEMRRLLSMGVDGIQSDRPDVLARVLTEETDRPPPPALRTRPDEERG